METNSKFIFNQYSLITKETPLGPVPYVAELFHSRMIRYQVQVPFSVVEHTMENSGPCLKYLLIFSPRADIIPGDQSFTVIYNHQDKKEEYVIDMRDQLDYFESMVLNSRQEFTRYTQTDISFAKLRLLMSKYVDIIQMPCVFDKYLMTVVPTLSDLFRKTDEFVKKEGFSITNSNCNETLEVSDYKVLCKKMVCTRFELEITDDQCVIEFETRSQASFFSVGLGNRRSNYVTDGKYRTSIINYLEAFQKYSENGKLMFVIMAFTFGDQEVSVRKFTSKNLDVIPLVVVEDNVVHTVEREITALLFPTREISVAMCEDHVGAKCAIDVSGKKICVKNIRLPLWKVEKIENVSIMRIPSKSGVDLFRMMYDDSQMKYLNMKSQYRDIMKLRSSDDKIK